MRLRDDDLVASAGLVKRSELLRWGNTDSDIRSGLRSGALKRVRNGWFATPTADADVERAVKSGGCLSCLSALAHHGVWTQTKGLHIRYGEHPRRIPPGSHQCTIPGRRRQPAVAIDDVPTALLAASRCCTEEDFIIAIDSAVNLQLISRDEVEYLFRNAPAAIQTCLAASALAESGTETMVRLRLRARGVELTPQVQIGSIGRVDFLIGSSLVIEVDSAEHHTSSEAYQSDRKRDRQLRALGYVVVRLTYEQVTSDWAAAEEDILAMIRRRDHRRAVVAC